MTENLDIFFSGLDSLDVTFNLEDGPRVVRGYFDNAYFDQSVGELILDTTQPRFTCKQSDAIGIPRETTVQIGSVLYSVLTVQPEGTGIATIHLAHE